MSLNFCSLSETCMKPISFPLEKQDYSNYPGTIRRTLPTKIMSLDRVVDFQNIKSLKTRTDIYIAKPDKGSGGGYSE